jgi:hypothetical protein
VRKTEKSFSAFVLVFSIFFLRLLMLFLVADEENKVIRDVDIFSIASVQVI